VILREAKELIPKSGCEDRHSILHNTIVYKDDMWNPFSDAAQGAVKGLGEAIKDAVSAFKANPEKVLEFEKDIEIATQTYAQTVVASINATMQAESKSEHWMQWSWRPTFGFAAAAILINNYILLPYLAQFGAQVIPVPMEVWMMVMAVLGVAAWTRGNVQAIQAGKETQK
jgi:hypothetical protein